MSYGQHDACTLWQRTKEASAIWFYDAKKPDSRSLTIRNTKSGPQSGNLTATAFARPMATPACKRTPRKISDTCSNFEDKLV